MNWENSSASTPLKRDFLTAWFGEDDRFFLTGGSALGLFYLHHRLSRDLDLFTTNETIDTQLLRNQVIRLSRHIGADCQPLQTTPDFLRFELRRGEDREVIDLVVDRVPQLDAEKHREGAIRVDTLREITANKWAALLGRSEVKDLVDLYFIERAGHDILSGFEDARQKDAGMDEAVLSQLLVAMRIRTLPDFLLEPLSIGELQSFADRLRRELALRAFPPEDGEEHTG